MSKQLKKVVLLLVEGDSEEVLLTQRIRQLFRQHEIRFHVENGDILFNWKRDRKSTKSVIGETVKQFLAKNKFNETDLLSVLHIIDIDGVFLSGEYISIDPEQTQKTIYKREAIMVSDERQKERIEERNVKRSSRIKEMCTAQTILPKKIEYQMYFFSRNLEHVLFDELNQPQRAKLSAIEHFMDHLEGPIEEFLMKFMILSAVEVNDYEAKYEWTWEQIMHNQTELTRFTNVPLLFEFIEKNSSGPLSHK